MRINDMTIELTRRCNMRCDHCMRGEAQNIDIKDEYLEALFSKVNSISCLTLTGGEPSLVPERIKKTLELAKKYRVSIGHFYMVTNAKQVSDEFMGAVLDLYLYCDDDDEMTSVAISNDTYHFSCDNDYDHQQNIKKLECFRFVGRKSAKDYEEYNDSMISQGFAEKNFSSRYEYSVSSFEDDLKEDIEGEANLYLNCKGILITDCNLSYETQDNCEFMQLGHITDDKLDLVKECLKYNKRLEDLGSNLLADVIDAAVAA